MEANARAKNKQRSNNATKLSDGSFDKLHLVIVQDPALLAFLPEQDWHAHCECECARGDSGHDRISIPMPAKASVENVECVWLCVLMCVHGCVVFVFVCLCLSLSLFSIYLSLNFSLALSTSLHCFDMLCSSIVNSLYVCTTGAT